MFNYRDLGVTAVFRQLLGNSFCGGDGDTAGEICRYASRIERPSKSANWEDFQGGKPTSP
jgi:hypothetical protein